MNEEKTIKKKKKKKKKKMEKIQIEWKIINNKYVNR